MLHNYCVKNGSNVNVEDSNSLFAPLNLVCETEKDIYRFNYDTRSDVPSLIFLYALLVKFEGRNSISFENIAVSFWMLFLFLSAAYRMDLASRTTL